MAVQNFKSRLGLVSRKSPANGSASLNYSIYNNNNNSSASNSSSDSSNRHYSSFYLPPMNSDVSSESMRSYSLETNTQQQHHYHQEQYSESQPWNQYSSNNQCSGSNHNSLACLYYHLIASPLNCTIEKAAASRICPYRFSLSFHSLYVYIKVKKAKKQKKKKKAN
ncbi:hypothetical protein K501DRAFT_9180 [Backusella circina FSU 941]|nr:hypothetical protein K501DRAFT_9180 [Backusella circina FSU 941]